MEIKFNQTLCRHLRRAVDQIQTQEQTQEVRLPDSMPDIGRVLGAWGKVLIRGKEWRNGGMGISGGVMAWVLYVPEDGSGPQSIETWVPFQLKWEFPETRHDGFICVEPRLKAIDARSISARKLMVRANVSAWGKGLESVETEVFGPQEVPEDVQLLTASYPVELPCESGEKLVETDDDLELHGVEKILRYDMTPVITEQKVMASRLVFRGKGLVHILYLSDGKVCAWDGEVPLSQYADLDREYGPNSGAEIRPVLTNMELDMAEECLQLKCSMAVQFVIYDRCVMELVEDAYSPLREVELQRQELQLPMRLDVRTEPVQLQQTVRADAEKIVDVSIISDLPKRQQNGDAADFDLQGIFQVLYYDRAGALQCAAARFDRKVQLPADSRISLDGSLMLEGAPRAAIEEDVEVSAGMELTVAAVAQQGQWMVTGLELGECREPDPRRPSLILRRYENTDLWSMAKEAGSTVTAIRQANDLTAEPEQGRMLLIPVS